MPLLSLSTLFYYIHNASEVVLMSDVIEFQSVNDYKRDEFIKYLDSEISYLDNNMKRPGWTIWAITGALATIIWMIISRIQQVGYVISNIYIILIFISLSEEFFKTLKAVLPNSNMSSSEKRFYHSVGSIGLTRSFMLLQLSRTTIQLIYITHLLNHLLPATNRIIIYIPNAYVAIISLLYYCY